MSEIGYYNYYNNNSMYTPDAVIDHYQQNNAEDQDWRTPTAIRVNETGKYPEIIGYQWAEEQEAA